MTTIGVIGGYEVNTAVRFLKDIYTNSDKKASFCVFDQNLGCVNLDFDIIIINNDKSLDKKLSNIIFSDEKIIIVNADNKNILKSIYSLRSVLNGNLKGKLITYGFNHKSCVTASSIAGDESKTLQYCIQRSIPTFTGKPIDEQEFSVSINDRHTQIDAALAAVTAALVAGIEVDEISGAMLT